MNFTSKRTKENDTWTTNRYLLPPSSKTSARSECGARHSDGRVIGNTLRT